MTTATRIGYVGLGAMGSALARRLADAHPLTVLDLNSVAVAAFEKLGATSAPNAAALARQCDVVMLCLPRSADVRQAIFGPGGVAEGLAPGKIVIDQSSGTPAETQAMGRDLAGRGVAMLDAPISGNPTVVAAGRATIMVSGPQDVIERVLPLLSAQATNVQRCGDRLGDAQAMKLVNNTMNAACRLATLEAVALGRKMGLSLESLTNVLNRGSASNRTSQVMLPALIEGRTSTNFALSLMLKDLNQSTRLGQKLDVPMPIADVVRGLLQTGVNTLGDGARLEDVVTLVESMAGTKIAGTAGAVDACRAATVGKGSPSVGFVGLGAMGAALARRLMLSRKVHVYDVRPDAVRGLEAEGAVAMPDLPSLARACDVILVCVPTSAVVDQLLFGPGGLAEGLAAGKIVIDQTTGDPTETRRMAMRLLQEHSVALVDAPVSGDPRGAIAGTIAIMCGGPAAAFASVKPILESVSPNVVYCGEVGNGHVAKLVNNAAAACNRLITYEAATMGFRYGLSLAHMAAVINTSSGWNGASERILPTLAARGQTANLQLSLMVKDLRLAGQMAMDCGAPVLIASIVRSLFEVGATQLGGTANLDDMARQFEAGAGIKFSTT